MATDDRGYVEVAGITVRLEAPEQGGSGGMAPRRNADSLAAGTHRAEAVHDDVAQDYVDGAATAASPQMRVVTKLDFWVVVKASPVMDASSMSEAVCVAGVPASEPRRWLRLFPLDFRSLPPDQRFKKY